MCVHGKRCLRNLKLTGGQKHITYEIIQFTFLFSAGECMAKGKASQIPTRTANIFSTHLVPELSRLTFCMFTSILTGIHRFSREHQLRTVLFMRLVKILGIQGRIFCKLFTSALLRKKCKSQNHQCSCLEQLPNAFQAPPTISCFLQYC